MIINSRNCNLISTDKPISGGKKNNEYRENHTSG